MSDNFDDLQTALDNLFKQNVEGVTRKGRKIERPKCGCGARVTHNIKDYMLGHAEYCDVNHDKTPPMGHKIQ